MTNFLRSLWFLPSVLMLAISPLGANPIEATFTGVNGAAGFGYYVGPYYGKLEQQSVTLYCVDFANDVSFGQQWSANLSHINTQAELANTRFGGGTDALQLYEEAAWLTEQYALNPQSDYADIQTTIWQLFDRYAPSPSSTYWLTQAQANYSTGNYDNFFVVTNVAPVYATGQIQEFLTVLSPSMPVYPALTPAGTVTTPEPRLLGALGLGLICLGVAVRRMRVRSP